MTDRVTKDPRHLSQTGLTTLERHNSRKLEEFKRAADPTPNGIACPKCGAELLDSNPLLTLASLPPQKETHCAKCSYKGTRFA